MSDTVSPVSRLTEARKQIDIVSQELVDEELCTELAAANTSIATVMDALADS